LRRFSGLIQYGIRFATIRASRRCWNGWSYHDVDDNKSRTGAVWVLLIFFILTQLHDPIEFTTPAWELRPALAPGAPNPFSRGTTLSFSLPTERAARLAVYDVAGRLVRRLVDEVLPAGDYDVDWDGRNDRGRRVAGGTYLVRLQAGGETLTEKVVFLGD